MHISINVKTSFFKPFIEVVGYVYVCNHMGVHLYKRTLIYIYKTLQLFINMFIFVFCFMNQSIRIVHIYIQSGYIIPSCPIPAIFPGR